jgi:ATP-binding cassette subfamily B protein
MSLVWAFLLAGLILFVDEPTSAVDTMTETVIMEARSRLMRGRTAFMIAHQLETLALCDMEVQPEKGRTVLDDVTQQHTCRMMRVWDGRVAVPRWHPSVQPASSATTSTFITFTDTLQ